MDLSELKEVMAKAVLREELPIDDKVYLRHQGQRITSQCSYHKVPNMSHGGYNIPQIIRNRIIKST